MADTWQVASLFVSNFDAPPDAPGIWYGIHQTCDQIRAKTWSKF